MKHSVPDRLFLLLSCLAGILSLSAVRLAAQPAWMWARGEGAGSQQEGYAVASDVNGNAYVTGYIQNSVSFGSYLVASAGAEDVFICKYSPSGNVLWAVGAGGNGSDGGNGIALDSVGNLYVCGYFSGNATFYGSPNIVLSSTGARDIFLAKYSNTGVLQWAKKAGSSGDDIGTAVTTRDSLVFITGSFKGTAVFGSLPSVSSAGADDVFIAAYNAANGNESWVLSGGGGANDEGTGIAADNSGIYVSGFFGSPSCSFQNQQGSLPSDGSEDAFLVKYDRSGNALWQRHAGSTGNDHANAVCTNGTAVAIAGYCGSDLYFYNSSGPAADTLDNFAFDDAFVASFDAVTGNYNWAVSENGTGVDHANSIAMSPAGYLFSCGYFEGSLPFGSGPAVTSNLEDPYLTAYSPAGVFLWGKRAASNDNENDEAMGVTTLGNNIQYVAGRFRSTPLVFDFSSIYANSNNDIFTAKVQCFVSTANAGPDQLICDSSTTLAGNSPAFGTGSWSLVSGTGTIVSPGQYNSGVTGLSPGANVFAWTITNGGCIPSSDTVVINMDPPPTPANAGSDQAICTSAATLAGNTITVGSGQWSLISGTGIISSPSSPASSVTGLSIGPNVFEWTSTNGVCPVSTDTVVIRVDENPTPAAAGPDQAICASASLLTGNPPIIGAGTWSLVSGTGTIVSANTYTSAINSMNAGANIFAWTITNGSCPASSDTVMINVDAMPTTANAGPDQTLCASSSVFAANAPAVGSGAWTLLAGTGTIDSATYSISAVNGLSTGANIFSWMISNGVCPSSSDTVTINVDAMPTVANAGPDQTICASSSVFAGNVPVTGAGSWSLLSGGGSIATAGSPVSAVTGLSTGPNVFQWTISSGVCPASSDTMIIQVDAMPDAANAGSDHLICMAADTLNANLPATGSGLWLVISGNATLLNAASPFSVVNNLSTGPNLFEWVITNGVCPVSRDTMQIIYTLPPSPAAAGPDQSVCGDSLVLQATLPTVGSGYWTSVSGEGLLSDTTDAAAVLTQLNGGPYAFTWTTTNSYCRSGPDTVMISLYTPPAPADAGSDQLIHTPSANLEAAPALVGTGTWSFAAGSGTIDSEHDHFTTARNLAAGVNVLVWTVSNGTCPATADSVRIERRLLVIPSGFSPNQDNVNDQFVVDGLLEYPGVTLEVFNRWGNSVYISDDYRNDWNGIGRRGETLPDDVYYYVLTVPGDQVYTGYVIIKRSTP